VHAPFTRDEFFSQAKDLTWVSQLIEQYPDQEDGPFTVTSTTEKVGVHLGARAGDHRHPDPARRGAVQPVAG
jgi:hypothetical protein